MKIATYGNGWAASFEGPSRPAGLYVATVRNAAGDVHDKVRCDDRRMALDYFRAFKAIAKAGR